MLFRTQTLVLLFGKIDKNTLLMFLEKKAHFLGNKTVDQHSGANLKNMFLQNVAANFLLF